MRYTLLPSLFAISALALCAQQSLAQTQYVRDDGAINASIGYGITSDYCWMQWFEAVNGVDTILSVQAYIPSSTPAGTPITFCVWDDLNDDGNPDDLLLLNATTTTVQQAGLNVFVNYPLNSHPIVHGKFFIGAYLTENGSMSPAALDYSVSPHVAYYSFSSAGTFDPVNMSNNFPPTHIETLGAGIHGVFMLRAEGSGDAPVVYCTAKTNSMGCQPSIGFIGTASASSSSGFLIHGSNLLNQKSGFLLYTTAGRASTPFFGGTLCLAAPIHRTPAQNSGGSTGGTSCTGLYTYDFNVRIASGIDPQLTAGATVDAQYYSRDPGFPLPNNVGLTDALEFTILP